MCEDALVIMRRSELPRSIRESSGEHLSVSGRSDADQRRSDSHEHVPHPEVQPKRRVSIEAAGHGEVHVSPLGVVTP
jgi:hypothetical protein